MAEIFLPEAAMAGSLALQALLDNIITKGSRNWDAMSRNVFWKLCYSMRLVHCGKTEVEVVILNSLFTTPIIFLLAYLAEF